MLKELTTSRERQRAGVRELKFIQSSRIIGQSLKTKKMHTFSNTFDWWDKKKVAAPRQRTVGVQTL